MFEPSLADAASDEQLRRQVRAALGRFDPSLEVIATDILGASERIDLLARNRHANPVAVLIAREGEDAALFTRALAQRVWLAAHAEDLRKLAPALGLRAQPSASALLLAPEFGPDTLLAAASLRADVLRLARYRQLRSGDETAVLIERVDLPSAAPSQEGQTPGRPVPPFRSGLSDADLGRSQPD